jgi:DNA-binding transcriptional LysR family regulator
METFPWYAAELFLRVCDAGGLSAASRFGRSVISQPALSAQMMTLERHLGQKLFHRKPFTLTPEGRIFRDEVMRMRTRLSRLRDALATGPERPLRIAASDVVIRDHLPALLRQLDAAARTRLVLREAPSQELPALVRDGEADLAIGALSRHVDTGSVPLVERLAWLPLKLLIPPSHAADVRDWRDLGRLLRGGDPPGLVALPPDNLLMLHITASLRRGGLEWQPTLQVSSLSHVPAYVALDFGFGFGIDLRGQPPETKGVVAIPLPREKMPPLALGMWHGEDPPPLATRLLDLIRRHAAKLAP